MVYLMVNLTPSHEGLLERFSLPQEVKILGNEAGLVGTLGKTIVPIDKNAGEDSIPAYHLAVIGDLEIIATENAIVRVSEALNAGYHGELNRWICRAMQSTSLSKEIGKHPSLW